MHTIAHHKNKQLDKNLEHHHKAMRLRNKVMLISINMKHHNEYPVVYQDEIEDKIDEVSELFVTNIKRLRIPVGMH